MTIAPDVLAPEAPPAGPGAAAVDAPPAPSEPRAPQGAEDGAGPEPISLPLSALAAWLGTAGAGWLVAGLLRDPVMPRALALVGAFLGVATVALSHRSTRPAVVQWLVLPVAALVGALAIAPVASGGTANLAGLVAEAVRSGGLLQPPIPFDPGWRFILVVLFALLGATGLSLALMTRRAKLAVLLPLPVAFGAALLQPDSSAVLASTVAIVFLVGGLSVTMGAELAGIAGGRGFEARRMARSGVMLLVLVSAIIGMSQADVLFPESRQDRIIPPREPPAVPPEPDRELFTVETSKPGPWRVGVLDVYDGATWLLPPIEAARVTEPPQGPPDGEAIRFTVTDLAGRTLPVPALLSSIEADATVEWDPRVGVPQLPQRVPAGFRYTVEVAPPPTAAQLNDAPPPNAEIVEQFVREAGTMPPPPSAVAKLLADAPAPAFDRLQFIRDRFYANITAAGAGSPVDVTPARVAQMVSGPSEATPFEITAAEALLARWAGVPARIGYGYYGGDRSGDSMSLRPKHGAAWLEAWFEGHGWVPLVGTPPRAKGSDSTDIKNEDPRVTPSDELSLTVFIPMQRPSSMLLFELVRYWFLRLLLAAAAVAAVVFTLPMAVKAARAARRRRWASQRGPLGRTLLAYATLRDRCRDLNLGDGRATPLEFVTAFTQDDEHDELAWLVTRALWGDLRRDLRASDADAAEELAASVWRRIAAEQTLLNRALGASARTSLRDPWTPQIPNLWPRRPRPRRRGRAPQRAPRVALGRSTALLLVAALALTACGTQGGLDGASAPIAYPGALEDGPPPPVLGYRFVPRPEAEAEYAAAGDRALVTEGRFYTIQKGDQIEGSLQVTLFRPDVDGSSTEIHDLIEESLGGGFTNFRIGTARVRYREERDQRMFLWFPPESNSMVLVVTRAAFTAADAVVTVLVGHVRGLAVEEFEVASGATPSPDDPTPTGPASECPTAEFRTTSVSTEYDPDLTLVPPAVAPDTIEAEARVTVRNPSNVAETYTVEVRADDVDEGALLGRTTVTVPPRGQELASVFWATAGHTDLERVAYRVTGTTPTEGAESYEVRPSDTRAEPLLRAAWLDPLALSESVYARDCAVDEAALRAMVDGMADVGVRSIIITYVEYLGGFFYPSELEFHDRDVDRTAAGAHLPFDVVETVLSQAERNGMHVVVGLGRSGDTELIASYDAPDWEERRDHAVTVASDVADELIGRYGHHDAFYGWYMTHELNALAGIGQYYDAVARHLDRYGPDKPVLAAPTGAPAISREELTSSEVDIFAWQDAVGAGYDPAAGYTYDPEVRLRELDQLFAGYRRLHEGTTKHLWADLELWEMDGSQGYAGAYPASFERVERQIRALADHVDVITAYEWGGFVDAPGTTAALQDDRAAQLYGDYDRYRRSQP